MGRAHVARAGQALRAARRSSSRRRPSGRVAAGPARRAGGDDLHRPRAILSAALRGAPRVGRRADRSGAQLGSSGEPGRAGVSARGAAAASGGAGEESAHAEEENSLMLTPDTIEATARAAFDTYRSRTRYRPLDAALRKAPLEDAYRIQDALHKVMAGAGRGEIAGWKIALTSKAMQQMTGVDQPAAGAIFSKVIHPSPARVDVTGYHHLGVEFEVAVRLSEALPASGGPWTRASVASKV